MSQTEEQARLILEELEEEEKEQGRGIYQPPRHPTEEGVIRMVDRLLKKSSVFHALAEESRINSITIAVDCKETRDIVVEVMKRRKRKPEKRERQANQ